MYEIDAIFWEQAFSIFDNQARFNEVKHMLKQQILFKEYSVGSLVDNAIYSYLDYGAVIGVNEYLEKLEAATLDQVRDYIKPFLTKDNFLNIRVNCDKK
jgi:predicted Zn-dependent peptidase